MSFTPGYKRNVDWCWIESLLAIKFPFDTGWPEMCTEHVEFNNVERRRMEMLHPFVQGVRI